jgi:hypothetical protein
MPMPEILRKKKKKMKFFFEIRSVSINAATMFGHPCLAGTPVLLLPEVLHHATLSWPDLGRGKD